MTADPRPLVIFPGALGDLVCFVPALREIARRSDAVPVLWCKGDLVPLATTAGIADARSIDSREASWLFSPSPPAEADALFGAFSSIDSFSGAGVPEVERNLARWNARRARAHPFRPREAIHIALHFLRCVSPDANLRSLPDAKLSLPPQVIASVDGRPLLVVHPGSGGRSKRWSRSAFREIARRWRDRSGRAVTVLGPAEAGEAKEWGRGGSDPVVCDLDVVGLAGLLAGSDAYLGNDSGASHLAAAVGARGIAIFGPTDPRCWKPLSDRLVALRPDRWSACDDDAPTEIIDTVTRALVACVSP